MTGGSGRLGTELRALMPDIVAPSSKELDVTSQASVARALKEHSPSVIVHAAAFTDVSGAEKNLKNCWESNVIGTKNIVAELSDDLTKLVYVSTDYVFEGDSGNYSESDPLGPALNFYSLSKIVAERCVRGVSNSLVIRTSFRPREWTYARAFSDMYTSQDYVDVVVKDLNLVLENIDEIDFECIHVATERKSVYELAKKRSNQVKEASRKSVKVRLPKDVSLNSSKWYNLKKQLLSKQLS